MHSIFSKITAMVMSLVLLSSTMSFTIDMHYCGNTLVDIAVFKEAKTCDMKVMMTAMSSCDSLQDFKPWCCSDDQIVVEGQDEIQLVKADFDITPPSFILPRQSLFEYKNVLFEKHQTTYKNYRPPLVTYDIYILDQSFLI